MAPKLPLPRGWKRRVRSSIAAGRAWPIQLEVQFTGRRRHLPVVSLRRAA